MARIKRKNKNWKRLGTAVVITAAVVLLYPLLTDFYARYERTQIEEPDQASYQLDEPSNNNVDSEQRTGGKPAQLVAWAHLDIPSIGVSTAIVAGTSPEKLAIAPGWYTESALPGKGNTAIAGHLNVYGSYFRRINTLQAGDQIILDYSGQTYNYEVETVATVDSFDWSMINPCGYNALTLTTCTTEGKDMRSVVRAKMVSIGSVENQNS